MMGNAASEDFVMDDAVLLDSPPPTAAGTGTACRRLWEFHPAIAKDGSQSQMSVFAYKDPGENIEHIETCVKFMKILRHPGIVKLLRVEDLNATSGSAYLITEKVTPLELMLDKLSSLEICRGLQNVLETVVFLHERANVCHNNLTAASIFVGDDGQWKLGCLEFMSKFSYATPVFLQKIQKFRNADAIAPEEKSGKTEPTAECAASRDAYTFGILGEQLLQYLKDLGDLTKTFEIRIQDEFLNADPRLRPELRTLLDDRLFKNDFVQIINFLRDVTVKTEQEKRVFFRSLVPKLLKLPSDLVASRLTRLLLSRFVILDETAETCVLPHLLMPIQADDTNSSSDAHLTPILPVPLFRKHVIPEIYKIFYVRQAHIRKVLLRNFEHYAPLLSHNVMEQFILPQILLGVRDEDDELVQLSLHALAHMVPLLGGDVVIGSQRSKIFAHSTPKFSALVENSECKENSSIPNQAHHPPKNLLGKPKLKDLARQEEKEKRRLEAKKRSEERRLKREQRAKKAQKVTHDDEIMSPEKKDQSSEKHLDRTESDIEREIEEEMRELSPVSSPPEKEEPSRQDVSVMFEPAPNVDWTSAVTDRLENLHNKPRIASRSGALKLKGPKPKMSPPPERADVSEQLVGPERRTSESGGGGVMKRNESSSGWDDWGMESPGDVGDAVTASPTSPGDADGWGNDTWGSPSDDTWDAPADAWDNDGDSWGGTASPNSPTSPASNPTHAKYSSGKRNLTGKVQSPTQHKPKDLGQEYEIKSVDVKHVQSQNDPYDFFADMAPVITTKPDLLTLLGSAQTSDASSKKSSSKMAMDKFSMKTDADILGSSEAAEWGEDLDWEIPED